MLWTIPFVENERRGLELDHYLTIYYCDWGEITNKSVYATVEACHGMRVPCNMVGHYVVMSSQRGAYTGTSNHEFTDMTLADFRHALDFFSTYFDNTLRETPSAVSVLAVQVSHRVEQKTYGRELFTSVAVSRDFPSTSDISPLSQALGIPIRVCQLSKRANTPGGAVSNEESWKNPFARVLMTDIDLRSENWGRTRQGWDLDRSVLLLREDREDLNLPWAKHISCYCLDVLKPLFEKALSGEISRQDVLDEITLAKAMTWKPIDTSTDLTVEPRPQRGFVRRMVSTRWEYEKQHSHELEKMDKMLKELGIS